MFPQVSDLELDHNVLLFGKGRGQSKRCAGGHDDASYGFMIDDIPKKIIILRLRSRTLSCMQEKPDVQCMLAAVSIAYGKVSDWVRKAHKLQLLN